MAPRYTIVIVPDSKSPLRKFHLSKRLLLSVFSIFVVFLLLCLVAVIQFSRKHAYSYASVQKQNLQLRADLQKSQLLTDKLKRKISNLTRLSAKLRLVAGLPRTNEKKAVTNLGMGGSTLGSASTPSPTPEILISLQRKADLLERNLTILNHFFDDRKAIPSLIPAQGLISSTFGARTDPFTSQPDFHEGIDISADMGTPVVAPADGVVTFAGARGNFGRVIEISHQYGFSTVFGHLELIMVTAGQKVQRGQRIGLIGNSGNSTGPHLHYEVHVNDQPVNPKPYLLDGIRTAKK